MQTGDPQGDSLFWPVITGENPSNAIIPPLSSTHAISTKPLHVGKTGDAGQHLVRQQHCQRLISHLNFLTAPRRHGCLDNRGAERYRKVSDGDRRARDDRARDAAAADLEETRFASAASSFGSFSPAHHRAGREFSHFGRESARLSNKVRSGSRFPTFARRSLATSVEESSTPCGSRRRSRFSRCAWRRRWRG